MRGWLILAPWLLLTISGCARGGGTDEPGPDHSPVRVEVTNNHALAAEIYAIGSGITQRLGTVDPGMDANFVIPQNLIAGGSGVELQALVAGGRQPFRSDKLLLAPGTIVEFIVAPQLFNSTATLRP